MLEINKLQFKQWKANKASVMFLFFYCACIGLVLPAFGKDNVIVSIIALSLCFIVQITPGLFVVEKENHSLETLLSSPMPMKKIYRGKALYSFCMITVVLYTSVILSWIMKLFRTGGLQVGVQEAVVIFLCIPASIYNLCDHAVYLSLKSNDSRACALSSIALSIVYMIMPVAIYTCISFPMRQWFVILAFYMVLNLVNAILLRLVTRKYMDKRQIFMAFRN
jgi:ABC-type transport system involved in cytochrome c biogenesis permease component